MSLPDPDVMRRRMALHVAQRALDRHQRRCSTCQRALRGPNGRCEAGRGLLYALEVASEMASSDPLRA